MANMTLDEFADRVDENAAGDQRVFSARDERVLQDEGYSAAIRRYEYTIHRRRIEDDRHIPLRRSDDRRDDGIGG